MEQTIRVKRPRGRPPKHLSALNDTKSQLIRSGLEILTENGFSSTGIDEILKNVGVPKGSFYHYFDSKNQFGLVLVDSYDQFFKDKLNHYLSDKTLNPIERLIAFMNNAEESMRRYDFKRGCLIGNLGQEMGRLNEEFRNRLIRVFQDWELIVKRCLEEAQEQGYISQKQNCTNLAHVFWVGWEGAVLRTKLERNAKPLNEFSMFFLASLQ